MASTYLQRTVGSAGNRKTWTVSLWIKINEDNFSDNLGILDRAGGYPDWDIGIDSSNQIRIRSAQGAGDVQLDLRSNNKLRDVNGWYHIVFKVDTTQATASDRAAIYLNGEEVTYAVSTYPAQNTDLLFNIAETIYINYYATYLPRPCLMSHFHFTDGYAYDATAFGETDATTGEWKIKTSPSVTYGTNGFFILKDGNSVTDQSGNGNNFTVAGGTLTNTEDCPSNVFATLNGVKPGIDVTLSNGNTTMVSGTESSRTPTQTTLGMASGKYYAEFKVTNSSYTIMGVVSTQDNSDVSRGTKYYTGHSAIGWGYNGVGGYILNDGSSVGGTWSTFAVGDIIGVAINLDDLQGGLNKLYFSKNGVWQNGANPSNHSSVVGVVGITAPSNTDEGFYYFSVGDGSGGTSSGAECNFGNGYFGTTAVSSAGTNASGNGIFEYDVPTGFTALSTKGLNL